MSYNIWNDIPARPLPELLSSIVDNRGKTVPTSDSGRVLIATNCIRNENLYPAYEKIRYLSEETYQTWFRAHPMPGDILFVCKGTPGRVCMVPDPIDFCIAQDMVALRVNSSVLYNRYLLTVLRSRTIQKQIESTSVGDVIPHFKKSFFDQIMIPLPPMEIQRLIGDYYFSFSNKIETNKVINDNLQQQAQALYAEMFLTNSDSNSTDGVLSDIATITMGQSPSGSSYNEDAIGEVFYQGRAEFGFRFPTRRLFTTESKRMAEAGDVLLSVRAPVGDLNVAYERCCIGRGLGAIHSKNGNSSFILYMMLALKPQLDVFNGQGTVFGSINRDALNAMVIEIPSAERVAKFEAIAHPMDDLIRTNYEEICRLEKMRDSLLPKLKLVVDATPEYEHYDKRKIIADNKQNTVRHAYYHEYRALQHLCLLILQHQKHQIGSGTRQIYGILFDGAWLWEEYINTLIDDLFYHPMNKGGKGAQHLFAGNIGLIYPDFISRNCGICIIADAKYKPIDNIGNRDYLQVLAYMFRFDAKKGLYFYPEVENTEDLQLWMNKGSTYEENVEPRNDICVTKHGLKIPNHTDHYIDFVARMNTYEKEFRKVLDTHAF